MKTLNKEELKAISGGGFSDFLCRIVARINAWLSTNNYQIRLDICDPVPPPGDDNGSGDGDDDGGKGSGGGNDGGPGGSG